MKPDSVPRTPSVVLLLAALLITASPAAAQEEAAPDLRAIVAMEKSDLAGVVGRYSADREALLRRWDVDYSTVRRKRLSAFYEGWLQQLDEVEMEGLGLEGRIDHVLLRSELRYELELLEREGLLAAELQVLVPFLPTIAALQEARRDLEPVDPREAAVALQDLADEVEGLRTELETSLDATAGEATVPSPIVALRAARALGSLRHDLEDWYAHYASYDPLFTWWAESPYSVADSMLAGYVDFVRERLVGHEAGGDEPIVGDPIGADGMRSDLEHEMIAYTPEELIAIGEREFAWCEAEMVRASRDMGFGDDWHAALEHVKTLHVDPGEQPDLVRDLAWEAVAFLEARDLLTIPPLAEEVWRLEMMSPEMQKIAPFFLGGEVIQVSFPTDGMAHEDKLMSMRGNNVHFSRATVHHELIPGHHLQGFMTRRYKPYRRIFATPFWLEGWPLHWEMLLWDLEYHQSPENRSGMLFWRMHRCARIVFSLSFHLGEMTAQECIVYLVNRVGHELDNATAEVRRSFAGGYGPLYQAAYMVGGLQMRALYYELVKSGRVTDREFHDAVLKENSMPIEMLRAKLTKQNLHENFTSCWKFLDHFDP